MVGMKRTLCQSHLLHPVPNSSLLLARRGICYDYVGTQHSTACFDPIFYIHSKMVQTSNSRHQCNMQHQLWPSSVSSGSIQSVLLRGGPIPSLTSIETQLESMDKWQNLFRPLNAHIAFRLQQNKPCALSCHYVGTM